jgi:putative nucleotidyltransferase with HDIG domain
LIEVAYRLASENYRDDWYTYTHASNVALLSSILATELGLDADLAFTSGLLHDIGKMHTTQIEHPVISYEILAHEGYTAEAEICLFHHRFQPDPYPLKKELPWVTPKIYQLAALIAFCDKVEAATTRNFLRPVDAIDNAYRLCPYHDPRFGPVLLRYMNGDAGRWRYQKRSMV